MRRLLLCCEALRNTDASGDVGDNSGGGYGDGVDGDKMNIDDDGGVDGDVVLSYTAVNLCDRRDDEGDRRDDGECGGMNIDDDVVDV